MKRGYKPEYNPEFGINNFYEQDDKISLVSEKKIFFERQIMSKTEVV